jgi:hypothetical protein
MTDKEKAELYYRALNTVLLKLQKHTANEESCGQLKAYLIGYLEGTVAEVKKESK